MALDLPMLAGIKLLTSQHPFKIFGIIRQGNAGRTVVS